MADTTKSELSGLSEDEAQEFHKIFSQSATIFIGVAAFAHLLAYIWRPWLLGEEQAFALLDRARDVANFIA